MHKFNFLFWSGGAWERGKSKLPAAAQGTRLELTMRTSSCMYTRLHKINGYKCNVVTTMLYCNIKCNGDIGMHIDNKVLDI